MPIFERDLFDHRTDVVYYNPPDSDLERIRQELEPRGISLSVQQLRDLFSSVPSWERDAAVSDVQNRGTPTIVSEGSAALNDFEETQRNIEGGPGLLLTRWLPRMQTIQAGDGCRVLALLIDALTVLLGLFVIACRLLMGPVGPGMWICVAAAILAGIVAFLTWILHQFRLA